MVVLAVAVCVTLLTPASIGVVQLASHAIFPQPRRGRGGDVGVDRCGDEAAFRVAGTWNVDRVCALQLVARFDGRPTADLIQFPYVFYEGRVPPPPPLSLDAP
jgi:hypothetical protein